MGITLKSASRLSALKSKIDSAVGSTSTTLSQAVDKAIARGNIQTEEQTFTPTAEGKIITPSSGKYLSKVTVNPVQASPLEVTPTENTQMLTPPANTFYSSVFVHAAQGGIEGVYTGKFTPDPGNIYFEIPLNVSVKDWAVFVMVSDDYPAFDHSVERIILLKEIPDGYASTIQSTAFYTYSVADTMIYNYTKSYQCDYIGFSGNMVYIEGHALTGSLQGTYTWYLIQ